MNKEKSSSRPLRADAVQNHSRIVEAARTLFSTKGLDAPLEDIAKLAGVGVGTLYRRFPNRQSLILAVFEQKLHQTTEMARAALNGSDPWAEFCTLLMFMFRIVAEDKGMREHFIGSRYPLNVAASAREGMIKLLDHTIKRAQSAGDLRKEVTVRDIPPMMLMVGVVADFGITTNPKLWERYAAIIIEGLRARVGLPELIEDSLTANEMALAMKT